MELVDRFVGPVAVAELDGVEALVAMTALVEGPVELADNPAAAPTVLVDCAEGLAAILVVRVDESAAKELVEDPAATVLVDDPAVSALVAGVNDPVTAAALLDGFGGSEAAEAALFDDTAAIVLVDGLAATALLVQVDGPSATELVATANGRVVTVLVDGPAAKTLVDGPALVMLDGVDGPAPAVAALEDESGDPAVSALVDAPDAADPIPGLFLFLDPY